MTAGIKSIKKSKRQVKERENWRQGKIGIELQNSKQHLHFHYEEIALGKWSAHTLPHTGKTWTRKQDHGSLSHKQFGVFNTGLEFNARVQT